MAGACEILEAPEIYQHQDALVAILRIGTRFGLEEEQKLVRTMLSNLARTDHSDHVEVGVGAVVRVIGKKPYYNVIDELLVPMETFSKAQGLMKSLGLESVSITEITDRWVRVVGCLVQAGFTMDGKTPISPGSLVRACMFFDEAESDDEKQQHTLAVRVLIRAGADWRAAMEDPRVGESARSLMKGFPEVRRGRLSEIASQKPTPAGKLKM